MPDLAETDHKQRAYVITGPTSGIGRATAFQLARHGTIVLVGRDPRKLDDVQKTIKKAGGQALPVVCDLSEPSSVRKTVQDIVALELSIIGLVNNAGLHQMRPTKNSVGWDLTFATNHLGPFALTEGLAPHMAEGGNLVFVVSGVEDPERKPAVLAGFRGGRYISAEASARGEWKAGGSALPGGDAYATSKQCNLATVLAFARDRRLHFNAVEPGFTPSSGLSREAGPVLRFLLKYVLPLFAPIVKYWSTPKRAAAVITKVVTDKSGATGVYYDDAGRPMQGSSQVRDPEFAERVVRETRGLLKQAAL
ncbi:SDR family NAD(P)-dependent oxidoreductase [Lichenicoccus sp.]|uniref:SDR family NAD(P)-dependent oxidoreductase n=1 Tax=Lichenicoccus sp. TaxID=2781899 RepID=UPI003D0D0528